RRLGIHPLRRGRRDLDRGDRLVLEGDQLRRLGLAGPGAAPGRRDQRDLGDEQPAEDLVRPVHALPPETASPSTVADGAGAWNRRGRLGRAIRRRWASTTTA